MSLKFIFKMLTFLGVLLAVLITWGANPVYSLLTLITSSLTLGVCLLMLGLEFIPFLIVLIYVGAVAVLFLFVVMMINFKLDQQQFYLPESFLFWFITVLNLVSTTYEVPLSFLTFFDSLSRSNFYSLGAYLYATNMIQTVLVVSLVLFVAMLGAISLTYVNSENFRSQNIPTQTRQPAAVYRLEKNF